MTKSRFDYVKYDAESQLEQATMKDAVTKVEMLLNRLPDSRAKALAITKLEEVYMWSGKAIRDHQLHRNPAFSLPSEERGNS